MNPSTTHNRIQDEPLDGDSPQGLDAYSADGQLLGRVGGYIDAVPENEGGFEEDREDLVGRDGKFIGPRHLFIDGHGYAMQAMITLPENQVQIDLKGRRVTVPLTMDEIRRLPHHVPSDHSQTL